MMKERLTVKIIIGPTASGKSAFALEQAEKCNGIIINADAMQCYKALPILSAQPSQAEQKQAPHKLYGFLESNTEFSAQEWRKSAEEQIINAHANNQTPILTGGSGFYINALIYGFSPIPEIPQDIREETRSLHQQIGNPEFHSALKVIDPEMASRLNQNDSQRLMRAYEVIKATGQSLAVWQEKPLQDPPIGMEFNITITTRPRHILHERINKRFDIMMDVGVMNEVEELSKQIDSGNVEETALIVKAHGFRPLRHYLKGEWTREQAAEQTKAETRQYAKRQETWARGQLKTTEHVKNIEMITLE